MIFINKNLVLFVFKGDICLMWGILVFDGAVKLLILISKGVAWSVMVFLKMSCLDYYPVILDIKSFGIKLNGI